MSTKDRFVKVDILFGISESRIIYLEQSKWAVATSQVLLLLGPVIASSKLVLKLWFPLWTSVAVNCLAKFTVAITPQHSPAASHGNLRNITLARAYRSYT